MYKPLQVLDHDHSKLVLVPWVATAVTLGPCLRPWRGVVMARTTHFY